MSRVVLRPHNRKALSAQTVVIYPQGRVMWPRELQERLGAPTHVLFEFDSTTHTLNLRSTTPARGTFVVRQLKQRPRWFYINARHALESQGLLPRGVPHHGIVGHHTEALVFPAPEENEDE